MKARVKPGRTKVEAAAELAARDNRVAKEIQRMLAHHHDPKNVPEPRLWDSDLFDEDALYAIHALAWKQFKGGDLDYREFARKMADTAPVLARPRITDRALDLWRMLSQPEILEDLWPNWKSKTGERGIDPGYFAKALLVTTAALGISAHFDDNHRELVGEAPPDGDRPTNRLQVVFDWVERTAAAAAGLRPQRFGRKVYENATLQVGRIVDQALNDGALTGEGCVFTNIQLFKWLNSIHPSAGLRLGIDGMFIKAWVEQSGKGSPEEEKRIRGRSPNASPRMIDDDFKGRGWYLFAITDLATNVPVAWGLWPGGDSNYEVRALRFLLNDLFEKWPECPTTHIVADRAWDVEEAIEDCATRFGIHLIVGRDQPSWNRKPTKLSRFDSEKIGAFDGRGIAYCRKHGTAMKRCAPQFAGPEQRRKMGLKPGEKLTKREWFRLRFECSDPDCTLEPHKAHLNMDRDWAALSAYPHTIDGGQTDRHAFRLAMYARRNSCEALFGALKLGHKLGLDGADRTHTDNEPTVETLLSLGLLLRTAFVVAHERALQGVGIIDPPDDLIAALEAL